jgi:hypothetical protein
VFVDPAEMVPSTTITPALAAEVEARLHQAMPRVFVKGETLKRRVRLIKARTKLGRAETADVLLPHESVSELHAEIEFDGQGFVLRDCGSTNGTLVDGDVLRAGARAIGRNTLLGFGSLRCLFVCIDPATAAADRRREERALQALIASGRLTKDVRKQVLAIVRSDTSQTIGEVLLAETAVEPADWTAALAASRGGTSWLDRLRRWFGRAPARP